MSINCSGIGNLPSYSSAKARSRDVGNRQIKINSGRSRGGLPGKDGVDEVIGMPLTGELMIETDGEETKVALGDALGVFALLAEKKSRRNKPPIAITTPKTIPTIKPVANFINCILYQLMNRLKAQLHCEGDK
jgi:hypothetical protein